MRRRGKTALSTGASRNIGKAIALVLAREGANLVLKAGELLPHSLAWGANSARPAC